MSEKRKSIESVTDWLGVTDVPNWRVARILGLSLSVTVGLLFLLALVAAFGVLLRMVFAGGEVTLGAGALVAALLGAPFVIWGTVLKHQTVLFQKEGHMTDRINKAVEQLGAEKTVEWIGRPVEILTGIPREYTSFRSEAVPQSLKELERVVGSKHVQRYDEDPSTGEVVETVGKEYTVRSWSKKITEIEKRGEPLDIDSTDEIVSYGKWQTFSRSVPNIEVRIGAILSLERIAQDSTRHDKGRDHVRVMEILCAYIRENAPSRKAVQIDFPQECHEGKVSDKQTVNPVSQILGLSGPRSDVQLALLVIGRRTHAQIEIEKSERTGNSKHYCLNLSHSNLQKADLEGMDFSNANFFRSQLQGVFCRNTDFTNCNFVYAQLTGANAREAKFVGARIEVCDLSYANLPNSDFSFCHFSHTHFVRSNLQGSTFKFLKNNENKEVNRVFFIESDIRYAFFKGDLVGCIFHFQKHEHEKYPRGCIGVKFKDCRLGATLGVFGEPITQLSYCQECLDVAFGDSSVFLPEGVVRPKHWPEWELNPMSFESQYEKWKTESVTYTPPPKPA